MRQVIEIGRNPLCKASSASWFGRLSAVLFGSADQHKIFALRHCSRHLLRDIGLLDDRRASALLRDERLFRR